jgi:hypothetical protein
MPIEGYGELLGHIPKLRLAFEAAGRDPDRAQITVYSSTGNRSILERYAERGVSRVVVSLPSSGGGDALRALDDHVSLIDDFGATETPQARSA